MDGGDPEAMMATLHLLSLVQLRGIKGVVTRHLEALEYVREQKLEQLAEEQAKRQRAAAQKEQQKEQQQQLEECVVCLERPRAVALVPCGHACVCQPCGDMMQECPVCRSHIEIRLRIFG